ncbi:MAG: hypothetical protein AB1489_39605 [Acidobacteriota bacterium]
MTEQRKRDLEDLLTKDYELLKRLEENHSVETDIIVKAKLEGQITERKDLIANRKSELADLMAANRDPNLSISGSTRSGSSSSFQLETEDTSAQLQSQKNGPITPINSNQPVPDPKGVLFVRIRIDSSYWDNTDSQRSGMKSLYPFDSPSCKYFYLKSPLEQQDPLFDVLISNKQDENLLILSVGLHIEETAEVTYLYGGPTARAFRITCDDAFKLEMPELKSIWPSLSRSYPPSKEDVEVNMRNQSVLLQLDDPVCVTPKQAYRFSLALIDYIDNMPNNVTARIVLDTDKGLLKSDLIYIFTY